MEQTEMIEMKEMARYHGLKDIAETVHPDNDNCENSYLSWKGVAACERDAFVEGMLLQLRNDNEMSLKCFCKAKCPHHSEVESLNCRNNGKCLDFTNFENVLNEDNMACPNVLKMLKVHNFRLADV